MNKVLKWISKHKKILIIIFIIFIALLIVFVSLKKVMNFLSPSTKESVYGDRCDSVKNIKVTEEDKTNVKNLIAGYENIEFVSMEVECKLIDIIINVTADQDFNIIDEMSKQLLTVINPEVVKNYDIQLFVTSSNPEDQNYPKIGTHHKMMIDSSDKNKKEPSMNDYFVW